MQKFHPIFENGQVLTSLHLNNLIVWLNQQDHSTRNKTIGVGIVCGLEVGFDSENKGVHISKGVAITSEGHLITQEDCFLPKFREYSLPTSTEIEGVFNIFLKDSFLNYPPFIEEDSQIPLWELLPEEFEPGPGETKPKPINETFLKDKVILLFLECSWESLKNCDLNDCSDKGGKSNFNIRKLLVNQNDAEEILEKEAEIAGRPVDLSSHPKFDLESLQLEKLNLFANDVTNFAELKNRFIEIGNSQSEIISSALQKSYEAYSYFLSDLFPLEQFPEGPFGSPNLFNNIFETINKNPFSIQHLYDFLSDIADSHNEFLEIAGQLETECCPEVDRFPKHVFLGIPQIINSLEDPVKKKLNPLEVNFDLGIATKPQPYRHHFIGSPNFGNQKDLIKKAQTLFYRTWLMVFRFNTDDVLKEDIQLTPSKSDPASLSEKSIPYYFKFNSEDDFHKSWSYEKTTKNRLNKVASHKLINSSDHPLRFQSDSDDFYRVEGILGKGLGHCLEEILTLKNTLGLSFGVEPVFLPFQDLSDAAENRVLEVSMRKAEKTLTSLFLCKLKDIDVAFMLIMGVLFDGLTKLLETIKEVKPKTLVATEISRKPEFHVFKPIAFSAVPQTTKPITPQPRVGRATNVFTGGTTKESVLMSRKLSKWNVTSYSKGTYIKNIAGKGTPDSSAGNLYVSVINKKGTGSFEDKFKKVIREVDFGAANKSLVEERLRKTLVLMDKTEELIETIHVPSVAEFDFDEFRERHESFKIAFEEYQLEDYQKGRKEAGKESVLESIQRIIAEETTFVANTSSSNPINIVADELQDRIRNVLKSFFLSNYSKTHPGMEHKSGVPKGGTLILLVTHKEFLNLKSTDKFITLKEIKKINEFVPIVLANRRIALKNNPRIPEKLKERINELKTFADALDDFVVLADFCLPTMCCESDCNELSLEDPFNPEVKKPIEKPKPEEERPKIKETKVTTKVTHRQGNKDVALANATIQVLPANSNKALRTGKTSTNGTFQFTAPPGSYVLKTSLSNFNPMNTSLILSGKPTQSVSIKLTPKIVNTTVSVIVNQKVGTRFSPIIRAQVAVLVTKANRVSTFKTGTTTTGGLFKFVAPPGTYRVRASATNFNLKETSIKLTGKTTQSLTITLVAKPKNGTLTGTVTRGRPPLRPVTKLAGATIVAVNTVNRAKQTRKSASNGKYTFSLPAGKYSVSISHPTLGAQPAKTIVISSNKVTTLNFNFPR